jgi:hypothetical protein
MARLRAFTGGALRDIKTLSVRQAGVLRPLKTLKVMDDGELRLVGLFALPLSVSATASISVVPGGPTSGIFIAVLLATPIGGLGPFTYSWSLTSGGGWSPTGSAPPAALQLSAPASAGEPAPSATYSVTVTDSVGQTATATVNL